MSKLPKWKCHKTVEAAKIVEILPGRGHLKTKLRLEGGVTVPVSRDYEVKHGVREDGYYVRYKDGYESFSPADAFEGSYTLLVDGEKTGERELREELLRLAVFHGACLNTNTLCNVDAVIVALRQPIGSVAQ